MLEKENKTQIIGQYKTHETDSGSSEIQIALLTERINELRQHLKDNRHDFPAQLGMMKLVAKRRRLLTYLARHNLARYQSTITRLNLRK